MCRPAMSCGRAVSAHQFLSAKYRSDLVFCCDVAADWWRSIMGVRSVCRREATMPEQPILTPELKADAKKAWEETNRLYDQDPDREGMTSEALMERARQNRARQNGAEE